MMVITKDFIMFKVSVLALAVADLPNIKRKEALKVKK